MSRPVLLICCVVSALASSFRPAAAAPPCALAQRACSAAATQTARACRSTCRRHDTPDCIDGCTVARHAARAACLAVDEPCTVACGGAPGDSDCLPDVRACRTTARVAQRNCATACSAGDPLRRTSCRERCWRAAATAEAGCGYQPVVAVDGAATLPDRPTGRPADLSLLEPAERDVIAAADARAQGLHTRAVRLAVGVPGATVRIVQTHHGFHFGFPINLGRFANADDRDWYARTMAAHFSDAVIENTLKWPTIAPADGVRDYTLPDADIDWASGLGLRVKGHTLMWGIVPPFSFSGAPAWVFARFAAVPLPAAEADALRELLHRHVAETVSRYRGRLAIWDASNETLQPLAQWFVQRLGPGIVDDVFRWAHEADPEAQLVFNEWIVEVFTGFQHPTAADVRDRVRDLRAHGVPVDAIGQQAHFAPAAAYAGIPSDLTQRTRIDDYARALDTLAEVGVPIHLTETNFVAPEDPERRAAQAEGLLRLWWGTPLVEQIVFWGPWNKVAGRDEFNVGFWDNQRQLSRHGEAVLSLLNDRWRTQVTAVADANGVVEFSATHGEHIAEWTAGGRTEHATFDVVPGVGRAAVAVLPK